MLNIRETDENKLILKDWMLAYVFNNKKKISSDGTRDTKNTKINDRFICTQSISNTRK